MKKLYLISALLLLFAFGSKAQESPLVGQYLMNNYFLNPAVTGTEKISPIRLMYHQQWAGFTDAPRTVALSFHRRMVKNRSRGVFTDPTHAIGGSVFSQMKGAQKQTGIQATYAYHIPFDRFLISMGASASFAQLNIDGSMLDFTVPGDPALADEENKKTTIPDADFGVYMYNRPASEDDKLFFFGLAAQQLVRPTVKFDELGTVESGLSRIVHLHGGYELVKRHIFTLEASALAMARLATELETEFHINTKATVYRSSRRHDDEYVSLMFSYRTQNSIVGGVSFEINEAFLGYSYTHHLSDIMPYNNATHQVMIGYNILR